MDIELRNLRKDEMESYIATTGVALFGAPIPADESTKFLDLLDLERSFCCVDDGQIVGTSANFTFNMTVPGGELPCAGVTMIGVLPSHRRRGLLNRMMRSLLDDARERGEPIAALYASEESIYQRYGFGLGSDQGRIDIERDRATFVEDGERVGRIRLVPIDEAKRLLPGIYDRLRPEVPGMLSRTDAWWRSHRLYDNKRQREGGGPLLCGVFENEGSLDGYVLYRIFGSWTDEGLPGTWLRVEELMGVDPIATKELWRFIFGVDLVQRIKAWYMPADLPLPLMLGEPRRLRFARSESLWVRLVDVGKALSGRTYRPDGPMTFEVRDAFCPWNEGRWTLADGSAEKTEEQPGLALDVSALGAIYLGAFSFNDLARAGRVTEMEKGALDHADDLFRTYRRPWCLENF